MSIKCALLASMLVLAVDAEAPREKAGSGLRIAVSLPATLASQPLDGRVLLVISKDDSTEPRFLINGGPGSQQIFGLDANQLRSGGSVVFGADAFGYPLERLTDVPPGTYTVQALLHKYETFHRSDGHVVKMPMDRGEGQQWNRAPGNLLSEPTRMRIDPARDETLTIAFARAIPPIEPPKDTKYVKHIRIRSDRLSTFWGRPMHLGAIVLLPEGFDEHPEARYPLVINHGHFEHTFTEFREEPPDPDFEPDYSARFDVHGYNRIQQQYAHAFYKEWTSPDFPRLLIVKVQHANPYYDDSYAVNSANVGPYGDAIMYELLPYVEKKFRGIGEGWARFTYGGSTGGWEALAVQMFYPDAFNGCFAACPDPIDFRAYELVNVYEDDNAYYFDGPWMRINRAGSRDGWGNVRSYLWQINKLEYVLGTKSRSGSQFDIWEAVFGPVGPDGYPARIWDRRTGKIDRKVAAYWREHFDLRHILERDWETLGPKLRGKLHIYCGTMDNYYLNNAVRLTEEFLESTTEPPYDGVVDFGEGAEHCWNGDHERPNAISRLRYHQMYIDRMLERMRESAPEGADLTSWRY